MQSLDSQVLSPPLTLEYARLNKVCTTAATPSEVSFENIKKALALNLPRYHEHPSFKDVKDRSKKIILVGGGPSLKDPINLENLRNLAKTAPTIACGSSHDWMVRQDIIPTFAAACDPDPIMANYYDLANDKTEFLLASCCDPSVYEKLKGKNIYIWHCHSDELDPKMRAIEPGYHGVGGGCTVGLRSISLAIMLGYTNIHFFGFDSCLGKYDSDHHAYEFTDEKNEQLGDIHNIKISYDSDTPGEVTYRCAGYHVAQTDHFKMFYSAYRQYFTPTFHGEGLLPDVVRMIQAEEARQMVGA